MKEVLPGIHVWSWFSEEKRIDFNGTYVRGEGESVVIDPPLFTDEDLREMEQLGAPVAILLTNVHHARRSRRLAEKFGIPIRIHEADAAGVDAEIAGTFRDGDSLPGGLQAINVPDSKSPGETAFLVSRAKVLIVGDALLGKPPGKLRCGGRPSRSLHPRMHPQPSAVVGVALGRGPSPDRFEGALSLNGAKPGRATTGGSTDTAEVPASPSIVE